jgi:PAS domain S-box-containing protein
LSADRESNEIPARLLEESAEDLYDTAPCGYLTTAIDGRLLKVNKTLTEWLGYDAGELISRKRFVDLLSVGGRIFHETHFNLLLRMQRSVDEIALDIVRKDGTPLPVLINARQQRNAAGEPVLNRYTVFNATERRMYERQLLESRNLFQTTLSSIGDAVVATDTAGHITFMNPVAQTLTGWGTEALGKPVDDVLVLIREDTKERIENPVVCALRTNSVTGLENHTLLVAKDGQVMNIDDSAAPIRDENERVTGGVLIFRDVSVRRQADIALSEAHKKLESLANELTRSNDELSQFAYVASHDLRSPLKTILQFSQLLQRKYADQLGDGRRLLDYMSDAARRLTALIDDLILYATVSSEPATGVSKADASIVMNAALENLAAIIQESGATVTFQPLPVVAIEPTHLLQVFQNLIGNSIKYRSAEAPVIHFAVAHQAAMLRFSCSDNGVGIAPEFLDKVFEPFKRLHGSAIPGSGIGLAVCQRIVSRREGSIWVESQLGKGSTFFFTLPSSISSEPT